MPSAWVTGGSRGIGRAVVLALAEAGHDIVLTYASAAQAAAEVVAAVQAHGRRAHAVCVDLRHPEAAQATLESVLAEQGCPDVLVHNAGMTRDGMFATASRQSWHDTLTCNLDSFYTVVRPLARQMLRRRSGQIVTITSLAGQRGNAGQVAYSASKAGLIGATKALALELGPRGITVNAVAPGLIDTAMAANVDKSAAQAAIPLGRLGRAEEVADLVCFLCSAQARYITGQVIGINGGLYT